MKRYVWLPALVLWVFCGQATLAQTTDRPAAAPPPQTTGGKDACRVTFVEIDVDKDGVVVGAEWIALCPASGEKGFRQADANRDGKVSKKEWQAWQKRHQKPSAAAKAKPKPAVKTKKAQETYAVHFVKIDQNRDGTVTVEELVALYPDQGRRIFHEADIDQDGKITHEEWHSWKVKNTPQKPVGKK